MVPAEMCAVGGPHWGRETHGHYTLLGEAFKENRLSTVTLLAPGATLQEAGLLGARRTAATLPRDVSRKGGCVKLEDLLGKHVKKGEEGHVVEGHAGAQASVVVSIRMMSDVRVGT